jgi:flagellar protein FliO/FliZ
VLVAVVSRPAPRQQTAGFRLPAEETYAVTEDSPLFTNSRQTAPAPVGVAEPPGLSLDVLDLTLKLVAVLALAYGSLALLKRAGIGGAGSVHGSSALGAESLRVMMSLVLAPNRSVHVVRAPGGKTLLLGATPGQVNLLAELGDIPEADLATSPSSSFLEVLTSKLGS